MKLHSLWSAVVLLVCSSQFAIGQVEIDGKKPASDTVSAAEKDDSEKDAVNDAVKDEETAKDAAEKQSGDEKPAGPGLTAEQVQALVEQLDSDEFAERTAATEQLGSAGLMAIKPLVDASRTGSVEVQFRAMKLLEGFYRSDDEAVHKETVKQLTELSKVKEKQLADQAKAILEVPHYDLVPGYWLGKGEVRVFGGLRKIELGGGGITVGGGVVRIGVGSQVVVSGEADGKRYVDILQGSGFGILMLDGEKREGIQIYTCQQKEDAKPEHHRYLAKDDAELKEKHPKIFRLYEKFKGYRGGTVMNGAVAIQ